MPGLYHRPIHRREFLKTSLIAGAALVVHSYARSLAAEASEELRMTLLSDTHIAPGGVTKTSRGFDPCANLRTAVAAILENPPQAIILNGDGAALEGLTTDYEELKSLLEPASRVAPLHIGFGNHDDRANFNQVFTDPAAGHAKVPEHRVTIIDQPFQRIVLLDSLLYVNKSAGLLGKQQRAWLTDYLQANTDKPLILFVHHTLGDADGELLDGDRLFEIIKPHPHVKAIFYGHSHRWKITERQGVKLINLPALGYSFADTEPVGWVDAIFRRDGVDLTLHAIAGNKDEDKKMTEIRWG